MADKRVIEQTASTELYNDDWFLKDSVVEGTTKISGVILKELLGADGTLALEEIANAIAEEYDSTHTYAYNSWVFHEGTLYRCISQSVTGTWDATKWQAKTIKEFIDTAKNSVLSTIEQMLGEYLPISTLDPQSIEAISKGDIFIYQRTNKYKFYRAKADHPQGVTEFDIDDWDEFDTVADLIEDVTEKIDEIEMPVKDVEVKTDSTYNSVVDASGNAKIDLSSMTAYGEVPNLPQAIASFSDGADAPMKSLKVAIEPVQDLHGYDAPWAGGAGKNKLPQPVDGTYTGNGVTAIVKDGVITLSGTTTASGNAIIIPLSSVATVPVGSYVHLLNSVANADVVPSFELSSDVGGTSAAFSLSSVNRIYQVPKSDVVTWDRIRFYLASGVTLSGTISPMLCLDNTARTFSSYSNICPISGWDEANVARCGKNLCKSTIHGYVSSTDNLIIIDNDTESAIFYAFEGKTYTISSSATMNKSRLALVGTDIVENYTPILQREILADNVNTWTATWTGWTVWYKCSSRQTAFDNSAQVELGSTATTYEPYAGTTYTIDLDGTRYGGTLDVVSGVLTVDRGMLTLNGSEAYYSIQSSSADDNTVLRVATGQVCNQNENQKSNYGTYNNNAWQLLASRVNTFVLGSEGNLYLQIPSSTASTVEEFKALFASNPLQVCYELTTPITIQLTPTQVKSLLGTNNVWADTGDINECVYRRDMSSTIDDIIARLEALENA